MGGWFQVNEPTWKLLYAPYHTSIYSKRCLRANYAPSRHLSRMVVVQNMAIFGVKDWPLWRAGSRLTSLPRNCFLQHITLHYIVQGVRGPFMLEFFKWQTRFIWRSGIIWQSIFIIGEREQYAARTLKIPIGCSAEDVSTLAPAAIKMNSMTVSD